MTFLISGQCNNKDCITHDEWQCEGNYMRGDKQEENKKVCSSCERDMTVFCVFIEKSYRGYYTNNAHIMMSQEVEQMIV